MIIWCLVLACNWIMTRFVLTCYHIPLFVVWDNHINLLKVKGLPEALASDPLVCSIYSPTYVKKVLPAVKSLKNGTAMFTFPDTPVKCAGAAQKICYLSEERMCKVVLLNIIILIKLGISVSLRLICGLLIHWNLHIALWIKLF